MNTARTDWRFRRGAQYLTATITKDAVGALELPVPVSLQKRRIYFGIVWTGWNDWMAEGVLELSRGGDVVPLKGRWGTTYDAFDLPNSWQASNGYRSSCGGLPPYSVRTFDPKSNPNFGQDSSGTDAMTWTTMHLTSISQNVGYAVTMFPLNYQMELDTIRFYFSRVSQTTSLGPQTVEVFLGCLSDA